MFFKKKDLETGLSQITCSSFIKIFLNKSQRIAETARTNTIFTKRLFLYFETEIKTNIHEKQNILLLALFNSLFYKYKPDFRIPIKNELKVKL